ncbi:MAG: FtsX-like permease family protein [Ilumatobacteraceae bacterium]
MEGVRLRVRAWIRARWRSALLVALLAGLVAGAVLALVAGARRTGSAPDRYTEASGGDPELTLLQPFGPSVAPLIRELPSVGEVRSLTFVGAFPVIADETEIGPNPFAGDDQALGGRVAEGRFTDPAAPDELTVNQAGGDLLDVEVGDRLPIASYSDEQIADNEFQPGVPTEGPSFEATVVGVVDYPTDFESPAPSRIFSQGVLDTYPDVGKVASFMTVRAAPGATAESVLADIRSLGDEVVVFEQESRTVTSATRRAVRLHVVALWAVAGVAAVVAILVISQLAARQLRAASADHDALQALGYSRREVVTESVIEAIALGAASSVVAIVVAVAASPLFPIGDLRIVEPSSGPSVDLLALLVGSAVIVLTFVVASMTVAMTGSRMPRSSARIRPGLPELAASAGAGSSLVNGVRFATSSSGVGRGRPVAVALSVVIGLAGLVGALVVGGSLFRLLDEPALYGADYDRLFGNAFVPTDRDLVTPAAADPDVEGLTAAASGALSLDGTDVPVLAYESIRGGVLPVILDGRAPAAPDEIALGRPVARALDVTLGDVVVAEGAEGPQTLRVVGYAVVPGDGGNGAAMTYGAYAALDPSATRHLLLVTFRDGADADAVAARLEKFAFTPPETESVPTSVGAFERVVPALYALAIVLAAMAAVALGYHLGSSVRRRTRDLAVLRALGADRRQLRATVHWQACCVALLGLLIGVPIGIAVGSRIYNAITDSIGVVPSVAFPFVFVLVVVVGVLLVANLAAMAPARRATRAPAATVLQEEPA